MRFVLFHSLPEALTYTLLVLVIILNIVSLEIQHNNTQQIIRQQNCIAAFFLQPNRTGLTLTNLSICGNVVNGIKH